MACFALITPTIVIATPVSPSSLLGKPSLFSLRRPIRLSPFITAVADNKSGDGIAIGGGSGSFGGGGSGSFGGGGGGGGEENDKEKEKRGGMSMSQKLTLGYAVLVGVGGVMGYMKSGSQKSLAAGGVSSLLLYYVYTQLPTNPAFASSLGLGVSAALLAVMGSRFKKSGKVFPAGVVSLVSLVMVGGYFHGIFRGMHG